MSSLRKLKVYLSRFVARDGGNVAIIFAAALPMVIGGAGFGVETSYWYYKDLQLQSAADAAAYAGAIDKRAGLDNTQVAATAENTAIANGFDSGAGTIVVNSPPLSGPNAGLPAVEVILTLPVERAFTSIFSSSPVIETARAVANYQSTGNACILALDPSASKSVLFSGNTATVINGCNVMSNSIAPDAITTQGSSNTSVGCLISTGGVNLAGGTLQESCAAPLTGAPPVADPFAGIAAPSATGTCLNGNGTALQPGYYCSGLNLKNSVTLAPGTYVVAGGDFKVNANASVIGSGVTIYLVGSSRVSMNGNATVDLSAPTSGAYSGVLFMGDRSNSDATANTFNGTASSSLTGALYFKSQPVQYLGNFSGQGGCTQVVADTIAWSGNTTIQEDCGMYGMQDIPSSQLVHLAE